MQTWEANYDRSFEAVRLSFEFSTDTSREITALTMNNDESFLYGASLGGHAPAEGVNVFKSDLELNFVWSKSVGDKFYANKGFEVDSSDTFLYFNFYESQWVHVRMYTANGTISYAKLINNIDTCEFTILSQDDQYTYNVFQNGMNVDDFIKYFI